MAKGLDSKTVKSAQRVLEVLQYVSDERANVTVMDISRVLNYPQSSTSELLSCLVHLGYLRHDRAKRTFHPTVRVAALGHHVQPRLTRRGALFSMIDEIHRETGYPTLISIIHRNALHHVYHAGDDRPLNALEAVSPLHSAMGEILLCDWDCAAVRALIHRLNAEAEDGDVVLASEFLERLETVRRRGYAIGPAGRNFSGRMVSLALPARDKEDSLAIGIVIGDRESESDLHDLVARVRGAIAGNERQSSLFRHWSADEAPVQQGMARSSLS